MKCALLSVTNKNGLPALATALQNSGYKLLSTGGTAKFLREAGFEVIDVSDFTGLDEMLDGRVKTLHPKIFAGILARATVADRAQLQELDWPTIDVVVVNLYDFQGTVSQPGVTLADGIEKIDIGGPSLLRAAAKNFWRVTVLCEPSDYSAVIRSLESRDGRVSEDLRFRLAKKVFVHTAGYDAAIANWLPEHLPA